MAKANAAVYGEHHPLYPPEPNKGQTVIFTCIFSWRGLEGKPLPTSHLLQMKSHLLQMKSHR